MSVMEVRSVTTNIAFMSTNKPRDFASQPVDDSCLEPLNCRNLNWIPGGDKRAHLHSNLFPIGDTGRPLPNTILYFIQIESRIVVGIDLAPNILGQNYLVIIFYPEGLKWH